MIYVYERNIQCKLSAVNNFAMLITIKMNFLSSLFTYLFKNLGFSGTLKMEVNGANL